MNRRDALRTLLAGGGLAAGGWLLSCVLRDCAGAAPASGSREAMFYERLSGRRVQCSLCPFRCVVPAGGRGACGVRENRGGTYYTLVHGWAAALNLDPIEKKPFFHYLPGSQAYSIGTVGCNLNCKDCQNWQISQALPEDIRRPISLPPATAAAQAATAGARVLAYTYNEPTVFYEYMYDTAQAGHARGIKSVMVSSGYMAREPMLRLAPHLDAIKIDLKGFSESFYRQYCGGSLEPVKETIKRVHALGKWLEIVCLIVPTINDDQEQIRQMCQWLLRAVGPLVPVHFTRFMPAYKLTHLPPTPVATLEACRQTALSVGLKYVYVGNAPGSAGENTYCASCGRVVVRRYGFQIREMNVKPNGACKFCGKKIPGVWD